jgi:hypothetical protein
MRFFEIRAKAVINAKTIPKAKEIRVKGIVIFKSAQNNGSAEL